jgi:predicted porin
MKKSLLALAVAAALPAFAYAQTNIILNGSVDVALEHVNTDSGGGTPTSGSPTAYGAGRALPSAARKSLAAG